MIGQWFACPSTARAPALAAAAGAFEPAPGGWAMDLFDPPRIGGLMAIAQGRPLGLVWGAEAHPDWKT